MKKSPQVARPGLAQRGSQDGKNRHRPDWLGARAVKGSPIRWIELGHTFLTYGPEPRGPQP